MEELTRPLETATELHNRILVNGSIAANALCEFAKDLKKMRDDKLYKEIGCSTFEQYCETKVGLKSSQAYNYISVVENLQADFLHSSGHLGIKKLALLGTIPQEQRADFIEKTNIEELTTRELQAEIKKIKEQAKIEVDTYKQLTEKEYSERLKELANKPPKIIDKTDYQAVDKLKNEILDKQQALDRLTRDKELLERKVKLNESEAKQYGELKSQIEFLSQEKDDISRKITSANELSGLVVKIDNMLKTELAPIRYSRSLERLDSDVAVRNIEDIINSVQSWCDDMRKIINKNVYIVEVE